jgi:DNA-binding transcriptional LysR family regulator
MRQLEALAGAPLLERTSRGVRATAAGRELYRNAQPLLVQAERVESVIAELRGRQIPIRLAVSHTIAEFALPSVLARYQAGHEAHLALELLLANSTVVREMVREGRADFGIAALDPEGGHPDRLAQIDLCEDEVVVALPSTHPWAARDSLTLEDLCQTPMVMRDPSANTRRIVEAALSERQMTLATPLAEVGSTAAAIEQATAVCAPVLLSRLALQAGVQGLVTRPVEGIRFQRRFVILRAPAKPLAAAAELLIEHLRASLASPQS